MLTAAALVLYWPTIFILSHIPIPQAVISANVSDKSIHFIAYFVLVCLLWFVISPGQKVNWRSSGVWWILAVIVCYGVVDEVLQARIGRSCDPADFVADMTGAFAGLGVLTFLPFWPASLVITAVTITVVSSLARRNFFELLPVVNTIFYLGGFTAFTLLWLRQIQTSFQFKTPSLKWFLVAWAGPAGLLLLVRLICLVAARPFDKRALVLSLASSAVTLAAVFIYAKKREKRQLP